MKLGLYGGTFDPVHHAHLILARQAVEQLGLDRLVFIPAAQSPFKPQVQAAPAEHRLQMIELAIQGEERFGVDGLEVGRKGPSYTFDTVEIYRRRQPASELYWLVGEDHVPALNRWHRFAELVTQVQFVILARAESVAETPYPVIRRRVDISATEIRNRVANDLPITYLVPEEVRRYLQAVKLYQGDEHRSPGASPALR
ncbi:MAG TPA: nicotinate (nicotinamide) nucleotide adenylyltransferase [Chthoniobacterales bacterium]